MHEGSDRVSAHRWLNPKPKVVVTLRVDADVMEWFRNKGKGYQIMMNAVLKGWVERHRT